MKIIYLFPLYLIALFGCSQPTTQDYGMGGTVAEAVAAHDDASPAIGLNDKAQQSPLENHNKTNEGQKKVVRTGNISLESKNITESKKNLDHTIKKLGGYYEQENTDFGSDYISYNLTVRIPENQFESFLTAVENTKDKLTNKSVRAEDVSMQYYDLESRLKSKRTYLDRYQKMVSSAKSVKDLLEIEEQIRVLQEEIERTESIFRNLNGQVSYSTITINLFEYQANLPIGSNSFWVRTKDALTFGWSLIENISLAILGVWPLIILIILGILVWKRIKRKRKV